MFAAAPGWRFSRHLLFCCLANLISCGADLHVAAGRPSQAHPHLNVNAHRPDAASWKRTQCGGPSGTADLTTEWGKAVDPSVQPLPLYPRPQMVRGPRNVLGGTSAARVRDLGADGCWANLNGLWEWEPASRTTSTPPFGRNLSGSILVPFPVESCLSGVAPNRSRDVVKKMWYRLSFDRDGASDKGACGSRTLLHFGAVDWQTTVYLNGQLLGNHTGGYDGFSFDITPQLRATGNELLVGVFDPSDAGRQPNGKQRISAIDGPGGDTYTPSSGIWQTVWLEAVPESHIGRLKIGQASRDTVTVLAEVAGNEATVSFEVLDGETVVATMTAASGQEVTAQLPSAKTWSPEAPHLYDLKVTTDRDAVLSYFGLRTFELSSAGAEQHGSDAKANTEPVRPLLNGAFTFLAGFLDQSWWPDGQYTAPSDEALEFDLKATKSFGLNMIRLHQKINPERWYYHADRLGLVIFQDLVQKYGGADNSTVELFVEDMRAAILGRGNHPCIVQWTTFNEMDCWRVFKDKPYDVEGITKLAKSLDPTRLVDTDSGGKANDYHLADVNDIHSYPYPGDPKPTSTQYAMVGEFGGIGAFISGKEWVPGKCHTYLKVDTSGQEASKYVEMAATLLKRADHISASVYTQTTDVELECDGFLNYDRTSKFDANETKMVYDANRALVNAASGGVLLPAGGPPPAGVHYI